MRAKTTVNLASVRSLLCWVLLSALCPWGRGQYSIDWYTIDGGGGTSTGGQYSLTATIGQPDAGGVMTGGSYSLTSGFWSLMAAVPSAGAPTLYISRAGNAVTVYWQSTGSWKLQENADLAAPAGWADSGGVTTNNGTNYLTLVNPSGTLFYRLKQ
jgi:hypothetical protein